MTTLEPSTPDSVPASKMMPRLSIAHFVFWMTTTALLLARSISSFGGVPPQNVIVSCVFVGAAITATFVTAYACSRGVSLRHTEPGHWFCFVATWEFLEHYIYRLGTPAWFAFIGIIAVLLLGLSVTNWPRLWKITFAAFAAAAFVSLIWRVTNDAGWNDVTNLLRGKVSPVCYGVVMLSQIAAITIDLRKPAFRDWIHWVGVVYVSLKWYGLIRAYVVPELLQ